LYKSAIDVKRHTTKVFAKAGLDIEAIGYVQASAAVPADEFQFGF